jgi:hypothetical protein
VARIRPQALRDQPKRHAQLELCDRRYYLFLARHRNRWGYVRMIAVREALRNKVSAIEDETSNEDYCRHASLRVGYPKG